MKYFLMLDYDGTLTPLKKHPKLARLSPSRRSFLKKLADRPEIKMAIVSGRELAPMKRMVGIPHLIYVGNHGLEIESDEKHWTYPAAIKFIRTLKKIKTALRLKLPYRGILIEDKGLTLSIHYRQLPAKTLARFNRNFGLAIKPWRSLVRITHGNKVYELRPPVAWDKGKAVKWLINNFKLKAYRPVYIGDDRTDEDAFRALRGTGITIHVGGGKTAARTRLKDVAGVYRYLRSLVNDEG
jgi:trehalose 6-phosphate phosphatase